MNIVLPKQKPSCQLKALVTNQVLFLNKNQQVKYIIRNFYSDFLSLEDIEVNISIYQYNNMKLSDLIDYKIIISNNQRLSYVIIDINQENHFY